MHDTVIAAFILLAAVLYASVGHAGASGYLAVMALGGIDPAVMKPTALVLNILAATLVTVRHVRAGWLSWRMLWPFVLGSVPLAFVGGAIRLPGEAYRPLVGAVLLYAAVRMLLRKAPLVATPVVPPRRSVAVGAGAGIGLLSGLTGTGGGIFLSPLMVLLGWADIRAASGTAAAFILLNSIAGLAGHMDSVGRLPTSLPLWATAAAIGAVIGAELGVRRLAPQVLGRLLSAVLVVAGLKLLFS